MEDIVKINFDGTVYENGYGQVAKKVMQDSNLQKSSKLLYAYICTFGSGAFPSRLKICHDLKISKTTASKCIKDLINNGYISVIHQRGTRGQFSRNIYTIELIQK